MRKKLKEESGFGVIGVILLSLIVAIVVVVVFWMITSQPDEPSTTSTVTSESSDELSEPEEIQSSEEWETYTNDTIGIAFSFPARLGEVELSFFDGVEGQGVRYELSFTNSENVGPFLSGASEDFAPGGVLNFGQLGIEHADQSAASSTQPYRVSSFEGKLSGKLYSLDDGTISESGAGNVSERHYVFDISGRFNSVVVHGTLRERNFTAEEAQLIERIALSLEEV